MIEAHGLVKRYGSTLAVNDLSFSIRPGLVTGFLGPNGAGKTTTMRMILGLDAPTQGSVTVGGRSYRDLPAPMREVGALLDAKALHGGRRARDHLLCLAQSNGIPRSRVDEVLRPVGLEGVARRRVKGFSLGMSQRLGIASALLGDPAVLIFDEPGNGLDPDGIRWVRTLMRELAAEGRTVLVSSHLMSEMALTAGHLLVIGKGQLIADTSVDEFVRSSSRQSVHVRSPQAAELAALCREAGATVRAGTLPGSGPSAADTADRPRRHRDHRDGQRRGGEAGRRPWHCPVRAHPRPGFAGGGVHGTDPGQRGIPGGGGDPVTGATIAAAGPDHRVAFRTATFADVLCSEWTKLRSVRSTFWALTVVVVLGVGLGAVISVAAAHGYARSSASGKLSWDPTGISLEGVGIATLAIAVLGVLCLSSEYSSGMIRTSLIAVPRRGRVLAAKSLVFAGVTFVLGEATCFTAFFVGQALISGHAPHAALGDPGVARAVVGGGLYLTVLAVLSVAAGTLLRHAAAAITCMVAVLFVLPGIAQALPDSWRNPVTEFWPTQAGSQLTSVYPSAHTLQPWPGFGVMCLFVAIVYAIAWTLLDRRDA